MSKQNEMMAKALKEYIQMNAQIKELWASDFRGKEYIKSMEANDRAELLKLMVTRKWGETNE